MYINFWYPICTSKSLDSAKPLSVQMFGLPFVAFRDEEGSAHVLANTCVHRGGSLSNGWVKDGCVICPYHGWSYGGDGKYQRVPSLPIGKGHKVPARAKVDSYPVEEKYGIVFAFLGDLPEIERPPLYEIEEYEDEAWRASETIILDINCYYERSMENGVDPVHNEFVHPIQGSPKPIPGSVKYPDIPWGTGVTSKMTEVGSKQHEEMASDPEVLNAGSWHYGPNTLITWITFGEGRSLHQYMFEAPVDADHTKVFFINLRSFMLEPEHDEYIRKANLRVTVEDIAVLEGLYPVRTPKTRTKEILIPGDKAIVRYRDMLENWSKQGWQLDRKAMKKKQGDMAFTIPCPDRRTSGNWVLDAVPLEQNYDNQEMDYWAYTH